MEITDDDYCELDAGESVQISRYVNCVARKNAEHRTLGYLCLPKSLQPYKRDGCNVSEIYSLLDQYFVGVSYDGATSQVREQF